MTGLGNEEPIVVFCEFLHFGKQLPERHQKAGVMIQTLCAFSLVMCLAGFREEPIEPTGRCIPLDLPVSLFPILLEEPRPKFRELRW